MSTHSTETDLQQFVDETPKGPFSQASIVDLIRQEAKEVAEATDVMIPVKGYESTGLRIKYRMPESGKELDAISRKVFREVKDTFSRNLFITMDTMALLCEGLYVFPQGEGFDNVSEPVELDPNNTGYPVGFDNTLARLIGLEFTDDRPPTARAIIKKLFGGDKGDLAIISHGEKLNRWLMDSKADLNTEFWEMGEF